MASHRPGNGSSSECMKRGVWKLAWKLSENLVKQMWSKCSPKLMILPSKSPYILFTQFSRSFHEGKTQRKTNLWQHPGTKVFTQVFTQVFTHPWDRMDGHGCTSHGLWLNMDAWVYGCVWVYMCMWMYCICMDVWLCMGVLASMHMGLYWYISLYGCVCIYIYIHMTLSCTLEAVTWMNVFASYFPHGNSQFYLWTKKLCKIKRIHQSVH